MDLNSAPSDVGQADNKNILDAISFIQEYYKDNERHNINYKEKIQLLEEENKKLNKKINEMNNLINNPQKFNNDTINHFKLLQSHKELQENFDTLSTQKQKIEQQLENNVELIKSKENDVKNLEKINLNLQEQASKYQFALGNATTYQLGDYDNNNSVRLNEVIVHLQDILEDYVTSLRQQQIKVNLKKVNKLFTKYQCNLEMNSRIKDLTLVKAVLQRHVIETIYENAITYFENVKDTNESQLLESEINSKANELISLMDKFAKTRSESDNVTLAVPIKIRQQIFAALSNNGFSDIVDDKQVKSEHKFIIQLKKNLNHEMEIYRKILDPKKKKEIEEKATKIICEVVRLFFFRLKTQEPIAKWKWFNNNDKIDPIQMTGSWDEDYVEDATVEICIFPLIYKDSDSSSSKLQIYTPAKVFIRDNYYSSSSAEEENEKSKSSKADTSWYSKITKKVPFKMSRSKQKWSINIVH